VVASAAALIVVVVGAEVVCGGGGVSGLMMGLSLMCMSFRTMACFLTNDDFHHYCNSILD
jgi:hypothetical protein